MRTFHVKGFTLIELLVAIALLLLGLTIMVQAIIPTLKLSTKGAQRAELQQVGLICLQEFKRDFQQTVPTGVSLSDEAEQSFVGCHPLKGLSQDGRQVWSEEFRLFWWDRNEKMLFHRVWTPARSALALDDMLVRPQLLTRPQMLEISREISLPQRRLASRVEAFEVVWSSTELPQLPLNLSFTLQAKNADPRDTLTIEHRFHFYNSL